MSDSTTYTLSSSDAVLSHSSAAATLLRDLSGHPEPREIDALVASGDLFVALATSLDATSNALTTDAPIAHPQLERVTSILLYLQRHYAITRKKSDYRQ
ncbi:MAG: hypothetical protein JWL89_433 [Candidatus Saccharibacteria bacterium]|nr:hypothetical protein [Candidatus Saccharibacteria bacterium]